MTSCFSFQAHTRLSDRDYDRDQRHLVSNTHLMQRPTLRLRPATSHFKHTLGSAAETQTSSSTHYTLRPRPAQVHTRLDERSLPLVTLYIHEN